MRVPAASLNCWLSSWPDVFVVRLLDWLACPRELVKSSTSPVDRITPVSPGTTPGEILSPFEYIPVAVARVRRRNHLDARAENGVCHIFGVYAFAHRLDRKFPSSYHCLPTTRLTAERLQRTQLSCVSNRAVFRTCVAARWRPDCWCPASGHIIATSLAHRFASC